MRASLTIALGEYDRTFALIAGKVQAEGVDLNVLPMSDAFLRHERMIRHEEFDACELSFSSFLMAKERGQRLVAIPVFPYRMFRHQFILVWQDRVGRPEDLAGRRVGTAMYQTTTMLWVRGMLLHEYGVAAQSVRWVTDRPELVAAADIRVQSAPDGDSVEAMFRRRELDALVLIEEVPEDLLQTPGVARLFPDFPAVEEAYFRRTGIYPMMHTVVLKEEVVARHPWIARNLYDAFCRSLADALMLEQSPRVVGLAWAQAYFEAERRVFGGSPYVYGISANRPSLDAVTQYSCEQHLTHRRFGLDELFVPSLLDS